MTMYTVMPTEQLWEGMWKEQLPMMEMSVAGRLIQVMPKDEKTGIIVRMLNGGLYDYLDPAYSPGREIPLYTGKIEQG